MKRDLDVQREVSAIPSGKRCECEEMDLEPVVSKSHVTCDLLPVQAHWVDQQRLSMILESYVEFHYCYYTIDNRKERALGS